MANYHAKYILLPFLLFTSGCRLSPFLANQNENIPTSTTLFQEQIITSTSANSTTLLQIYSDAWINPTSSIELNDKSITLHSQKINLNDTKNRFTVNGEFPVFAVSARANTEKFLNNEMKKTINGAITNFTTDVKDWNKNGYQSGDVPSGMSIYFKPYILTKNLISLQLSLSPYLSGGAHPNHYRIGFMYDLTGNKIFGLKDFFEKDVDYLNKISKLITKQQLAEYNQDNDPTFEANLRQYTAPKKENFQDFIATKDGLMFFFTVHEAGPNIAFTSWSELTDVLDKNGPAKDFISQ